ncbi:MAG: response regulator [Endomicrobium sp.]|jgi:YesN/AraC family two-component response regulator|nr:response regulator [Endomicrobium sp.]
MSVQKGKILVVDDEQGIRELLISEFSKLGYGVLFAVNGEDAISKLQSEKAELIITDMNMPKLDGMDVLKYVKENSPESEVIIITGYAAVENVLEAMQNGAYGFIQKPFNIDELAALAEKAMEKTELKTLVSIYKDASRFFSYLNLKELLSVITAAAMKITHCSQAGVFLADGSGKLYLAFSQPDAAEQKKELENMPSYSFFSVSSDIYDKQKTEIEKAVSEIYADESKRAEPVFFDSDSAPEAYKSIFIPGIDVKSVVLYPMVLNEKVTGYLFMAKDSRVLPFSRADLKNISIVVSQISQAVYNAQTFERLEAAVPKQDAAESLSADEAL